MDPLRFTAKFDPFLSLDCTPPPPALHPGAIQGKELIKVCHLATLDATGEARRRLTEEVRKVCGGGDSGVQEGERDLCVDVRVQLFRG